MNHAIPTPIKRHRPGHDTNKVAESNPIAPLDIESFNTLPKKRHRPDHDTSVVAYSIPPIGPNIETFIHLPKRRYLPPSFFRPAEDQRLYRLNYTPTYYTPANRSSNANNALTISIGNISSIPLSTTMTSTGPPKSYSLSLPALPCSSSVSPRVPDSTDSNTSPNNKNDEGRPQLSDEQRRILDMVVNDRQSIFLTGSAGTGKSVLMREMIRNLRAKYGEAVAVTASTGIAACNIGGGTLHGFAGIGLGKESSSRLIERIRMNPAAMQRWQTTQILIIDEISMVDAALFDKLADIGQHIRGQNVPFGGIQVIATGDFFQLPPVKASGFAFEAGSWSNIFQKTVVLTHVYRQADPEFVDILNEMRVGLLSEKARLLFKSLERLLPESSIEPTKLYPLKHEVEWSNNMRLKALMGSMHEFKASDSGQDLTKLENCRAPALLRLKVNAQVMLLKNVDATLVNGSLGIVIGFAGEKGFGTADIIKSRLLPRRREKVEDVDLEHILSSHYPVVRFANGREHVVENESWSVNLADGTRVANRNQIPLVLAWAMSIHKSQGQTLDRVVVDLNEAFEDGMAYVAISRATSQHSLQINNFNPRKVTASKKVVDFYKTLQ